MQTMALVVVVAAAAALAAAGAQRSPQGPLLDALAPAAGAELAVDQPQGLQDGTLVRTAVAGGIGAVKGAGLAALNSGLIGQGSSISGSGVSGSGVSGGVNVSGASSGYGGSYYAGVRA